jgi:hypothetical protein
MKNATGALHMCRVTFGPVAGHTKLGCAAFCAEHECRKLRVALPAAGVIILARRRRYKYTRTGTALKLTLGLRQEAPAATQQP